MNNITEIVTGMFMEDKNTVRMNDGLYLSCLCYHHEINSMCPVYLEKRRINPFYYETKKADLGNASIR